MAFHSFWPLNHDYFTDYALRIGCVATMGQFLDEAFSFHNLYVFFLEFAVMKPFILILGLFNLKRGFRAENVD